MIINSPFNHSNLTKSQKNSFSIERLKSRSKSDKRNYRIANNKNYPKKSRQNENSQKIYNSVQNKNILNELHKLNYKIKVENKDQMPYIPNKERQKAESNFINLITELANIRKKSSQMNKNNLINNNIGDIPYKPKGYNCFEYIREHPLLISNSNDNNYLKIISRLQNKKDEKKVSYKNNDINRSHKSFGKLTKNPNNINNVFPKEENEQINNNPIILKSYNSFKTINYNSGLSRNEVLKSDEFSSNTMDFNSNNLLLPKINDKFYTPISITSNNDNDHDHDKKDYRQSDIFNLIDNDVSKNKSGEKYLFKKNYLPPKIQSTEKTSLIDVGWVPHGQTNKSRIGCPSVAFNILSPSLKSISPMKKEIDLMNRNNYEKAPLISDYNKVKPGYTNLRNEYTDILNENKNAFHKKNYCAAYYDLHHEYKDLVNNVF